MKIFLFIYLNGFLFNMARIFLNARKERKEEEVNVSLWYLLLASIILSIFWPLISLGCILKKMNILEKLEKSKNK